MKDTSDPNEGSRSEPYFEAFSKDYLVNALKMIITQASLSAKHGMYKAECVLPYRLLRALVDKPELGLPVLDEVMFDLVCCLKQQITDLGGLGSSQTRGTKPVKLRGAMAEESSKKPSKKGALKAEILQSSNLFFSSLDPEVFWKWMTNLLKDTFSQQQSTVGESAASTKSEHDSRPITNEKAEENLVDNNVVIVDREGSHSSSPIAELVVVHEAQSTDKLEQGQQEKREGEGEEQRSGQPNDQRTTSNQASSSLVVNNRCDFSFVLELIKFLIQSLPLVRKIISSSIVVEVHAYAIHYGNGT